jgi:hypothetical protein
MKTTKILFILLVISFINLIAQDDISEEIKVSELKDHVYYLASDKLEGRKPGTNGGKLAAEYLKEKLKKLAVTLLGDDGFQYFEVLQDIKLGKNNKFSFDNFTAKPEENFMPLAVSGKGELTARAVFVGYGFSFEDDSTSWNDYEDIDAQNKWAIILRGSPDDSHGSPYTNYSSLRKKVLVAKDNGAAGVVFISGENFDPTDELIKISVNRRESSVDIPVVHVKREVINKLLEEYELTVPDLEKSLNKNLNPASFEIEKEISAEIDLVEIRVQTQNVAAMIEGNDPVLKDEYIVVGAHYDHLGYGGFGSGSRVPDTNAIHYGADDNASGTAANLELFERLALNKDKLKRSIIYLAFGAEEMGVLGSKFFTNNPIVDLDKIKFMNNLDMIGKLDSASKTTTVSGTGTAIGLSELLTELDQKSELNLEQSTEGYGPSDHASFYTYDIPVAFFFSGIHADYHTPRDTPDKLNYEGTKLIADFAYDLVLEIANKDDALVFREAGPKEHSQSYRRFKVTLGIMPDVAGTVKNGLRADAVIEGRPAHTAGMKKGDIITTIDGKPIKDIYDYMNRLSDYKPGDRISVDVMRGNEKVILIIDL